MSGGTWIRGNKSGPLMTRIKKRILLDVDGHRATQTFSIRVYEDVVKLLRRQGPKRLICCSLRSGNAASPQTDPHKHSNSQPTESFPHDPTQSLPNTKLEL